ncbi:MAG: adenylate kinase [Gemmatimonadales bacterium]|nr:MAG: adenylate kinase [Gemmatimonadales bacterium]
MVVILLGPPGVGKGTQGARLVDDLGWVRIATGDLLRSARRAGSELGDKAREYMDAGELVPDDLIVALVREHLEKLDPEVGVLFDGFPRTVPQAVSLDAMLPEVSRKVDGVLLFEAPDDVLFKRISGRRSSPEGRVYNVYFDPPKADGVCDVTGSPLVHREDDRPETVERRLEVYQKQTSPLISYYDAAPTRVMRIQGDGDMEEVRGAVREALATELGAGAAGA